MIFVLVVCYLFVWVIEGPSVELKRNWRSSLTILDKSRSFSILFDAEKIKLNKLIRQITFSSSRVKK